MVDPLVPAQGAQRQPMPQAGQTDRGSSPAHADQGAMGELAPLTGAAATLSGIDALLLRLDGVLASLGSLHAVAWKRLCDEIQADAAAGHPFTPFDTLAEFQSRFAGRPAARALSAYLDEKGIAVPVGADGDPDTAMTLHGLLARRLRYVLEAVDTEGVEIFPGSVELVAFTRERGFRIAVVGDGASEETVLTQTGLFELVDGPTVSETEPGAGFLHAAQRLELPAARCAVVDVLPTGIARARADGFGLVIGLDRNGDPTAHQGALADLVVTDLSELMPGGGPPRALACLNAITTGLSRRKVALFLDYDGTLAPIVDRPEDAVLPAETRAALESLSQVAMLAFVSGRMKDEVRAFVGLENVFYAGSHGFAIEGPDGLDFVQEDGRAIMPVIREAALGLTRDLADLPGTRVEDKHFAVAIHYRLVASERVPEVEAAVDRAVARFPALRKSGGKMVFELRPRVDWHKGKALDYLLTVLGLTDDTVLPIYIGDDVTDEDAFEALQGRGIGICVKDQPAPTAAAFRVRDPAEVCQFLRRLDDAIRTWGASF
ncbi:MAG: trehalose-phosphatase [Alphaproteobacteria bacterium]